jgi:hypothetical protein
MSKEVARPDGADAPHVDGRPTIRKPLVPDLASLFEQASAPELHVEDSTAERLRLERIVERGMREFVNVGLAMERIRDGRLYRPEFLTFEEYLDKRWGFARSTGYGYIRAAEVAERVRTCGHRLPSQRHAEILAPLPPHQQVALAPEVAKLSVLDAKALVKRHRKAFSCDSDEFSHADALEDAKAYKTGPGDPDFEQRRLRHALAAILDMEPAVIAEALDLLDLDDRRVRLDDLGLAAERLLSIATAAREREAA